MLVLGLLTLMAIAITAVLEFPHIFGRYQAYERVLIPLIITYGLLAIENIIGTIRASIESGGRPGST
jgi:hypothetical protein